MAPSPEVLAEGIDRVWLERQAQKNPVPHAWAIWDLDHEAGRFRFVSLLRDGGTVGYLLIWYGGEIPRAHWISEDPDDGLLALGLPLPPVLAYVPARVAAAVQHRLHGTQSVPMDVLVCTGRTVTPPDPRVRRLQPADAAVLSEFLATHSDAELGGYAPEELARRLAWGAFEADRLVAVARAAVQLPAVWVVTGVFTDPAFRGRGLGREVTTAATTAALASGARVALYVRADNAPAQTIYREIGYAPVDRRVLVEARGEAPPF